MQSFSITLYRYFQFIHFILDNPHPHPRSPQSYQAVLLDKLGLQLDHRQWELLVSALDRDSSGTVSFDEFQRWYLLNLKDE